MLIFETNSKNEINQRTKFFSFELNKMLNQYFVYQKGSEATSNPVKDAKIQARFFEHGLLELLDQVNQ